MNASATVSTEPVDTSFKQKLTIRQKLTDWKLGGYSIAICLALVGLAGYRAFSGVLPVAGSPAAALEMDDSEVLTKYSDAGAVWVSTAVLQSATVSELPRLFTGLVKPSRSSDLGFKRTGRITKVSVDQGDRVTKGQVLAELDVDWLGASLLETQAQLAVAEAKLAELVVGPRVQTIQAARAQVADQTAQVRLAESQFQRTKSLRGSGAISAQDYDDAQYQLAAVQGRLNVVASQLEELEAGTRVEQVDAQKAIVAQLEAAVSRLEVDIQESQLLAPYDAIISKRILDEGAIVPAGSVVLRLVESSNAEVWIGLPTQTIAALDREVQYPISLNGKIFQTKLRTVLPELDAATRTQTAIFLLPLPEDEDQVVPAFGQLARLPLTRRIDQAGFWLPTTALSRGQRGLWSVMIVEENAGDSGIGVLQRRDVEVLQVDTGRVLVRGTVLSGQRYVMSGIHRLTPGQRVHIQDDGSLKATLP